MILLNRLLAALLACALCAQPVLAADISASSWSETDSSNTSASPNGWANGTFPNQVEPIGRATMGAIKRFYDHINGTATSGGTANAQTLTYTVAPTAYVAGDTYTFFVGANLTNTGATTLNVNALGAVAVQKGGSALIGGELVAGTLATVVYDGTHFQLSGTTVAITAGLINNTPIGATTPSTGAFTTLSGSEAVTGGGLSTNLTPQLNVNQTLTGQAGGASVGNVIGSTSDALDLGTGAGSYLYMLQVHDTLTAAAKGGRVAFQSYLDLNSGIAAGNGTPFFVAVAGEASLGAADASTTGQLFGSNFAARVTSSSATGLSELIGQELDVTTQANVGYRVGEQVVIEAAGTGHGTTFDAAYTVGMQTGGAGGWRNGLAFSDPRGPFAFDTSATLITTNIAPLSGAVAFTNAMDFRNSTISGDLLVSDNFTLTGAGNMTLAAAATLTYGSGGITRTANSRVYFYGDDAFNDVISASNGASIIFKTGISGTTAALTIDTTGFLTYSGVTTGTPAASLCLDSSNKIIKKTTTGACI